MGKTRCAPEVATWEEAEARWRKMQDADSNLGSGVIAALAAVAVGIDALLRDNLTVGGAVGTAVGATGAYLLCDHLKTSMQVSAAIGSSAGTVGVVLGNKAHNKLCPEQAERKGYLSLGSILEKQSSSGLSASGLEYKDLSKVPGL